jgi:hypothetical protein
VKRYYLEEIGIRCKIILKWILIKYNKRSQRDLFGSEDTPVALCLKTVSSSQVAFGFILRVKGVD